MKPLNTAKSLRRFQIAGYVSVFLAVGVLGGWSAFASIHGAVIAPATIVVESNTKRIQHRDGGIVDALLVKDGDHVEAGPDLVVLDSTDNVAELGIIDSVLSEELAKRARLEAERDEAAEVVFPEQLVSRQNDPDIAKLMIGQQKLFAAKRATIQGKVEQLKQQIGQIDEQVQGILAQADAKERQIKLIGEELVGLLDLQAKGLVPNTRVLAMQRERARLEGERGELIATKASAESRVGEVKLQILQIREETLSETLAQLRETEARIAELNERRVSIKTRLERTTIRAPISGAVYQLSVHTVGGVITPAETLMLIVPESDDLVLQAQVPPSQIDRVTLGQTARVRFSAFDTRVTPEIGAEVTHVAADVSRVDANSPPFYMVQLKSPATELALLGDNRLRPGMPAEAFIQTGARTPLSYMVKPLFDQI
ncbi:MAG: HlyD family type I secretion periplasmic adaptor subunit, partial [Aestuariivirga sp.]